MTEREAWLTQRIEEVIDPGLPMCDPHNHLWASPDRRYLLEDLFRDLGGGHNIV